MPLRPAAFTSLTRYVDPNINLSAFRIREVPVTFDWGFDMDVPWERLSIFARHMDTAAPVTRVPVFALIEFGLTRDSAAAIDDPEVLAAIAFPKFPLGVVATDHVGDGSFDLWPLRTEPGSGRRRRHGVQTDRAHAQRNRACRARVHSKAG